MILASPGGTATLPQAPGWENGYGAVAGDRPGSPEMLLEGSQDPQDRLWKIFWIMVAAGDNLLTSRLKMNNTDF